MWGVSGAGKSHLVEHWASKPSNRQKFGFVGRAKLDQQARRPLSSFSQIFESLIDRLITNPKVRPAIWVESMKQALDSQFPLFVATLSQEHRRILDLDLHDDQIKLNVSLSAQMFSRSLSSVGAASDRFRFVSLVTSTGLTVVGRNVFCSRSHYRQSHYCS